MPTSNVSSKVTRNGMVCGIFLVATSRPSTFSTQLLPFLSLHRM